MKPKVTIDKAIEILRKKFEEVEFDPRINDPVAFALYSTWREVDEKNRGRAQHG